jgi:long-subunit fatty acid transport protein
VLLLPLQAISSELNIGSSYNPVGSGARAIGMGGAFIGVADDATAASWNPGGLVQLEKSEISIVGSFLKRNDDFVTNQFLENQSESYNSINYFSLTHCFSYFQRNMVISLNYQNLYDFNRDWSNLQISTTKIGTTYTIPDKDVTIQYQTDFEIENIKYDGNLSALGLACSFEVNPKFSFGITFNIWDNDLFKNAWKTKFDTKVTVNKITEEPSKNPIIERNGELEPFYSKREYSLENGFNTNIGFLWHITSALTLGGVYKSRFTADLKQSSIMNNEQKPDESNELTMPSSYGIGLAWRLQNIWTLSLDIYRTEWDEFILKNSFEEISPLIPSMPDENNSINAQPIPIIKPTHQVRFGTEYLVINKANKTIIPFRFGLFYDPIPGKGYPDKAWGFSLGSGFSKSPYNFDIAFQYRQANDIGDVFPSNANLTFDMNETILYTSMIYHF